MRVAYLAFTDPSAPDAWSGMLAGARRALAARADIVDVVVDAGDHHALDRAAARGLGAVGVPYLPAHGAATAVRLGRRTTHALAGVNVDAVVAVAASTLTAFAEFPAPLVSVSDATVPLLAKAYPDYRALPAWALRQAAWVERRSWQRSAARVVTSAWAAKSLATDYGIPDARVIPFGPGIPAPAEYAEPTFKSQADQPRPDTHPRDLRLLVVARDWHRKRGDRAVALMRLLSAHGVAAQMTVVGAVPEDIDLPGVTCLGVLSREGLAGEYRGADVLVDLASANCAAVTLTDAAAWGLPVIATDVGGAGEIVAEGLSGILVADGHDTVAQAADAVVRLSDPGVLVRMRAAALDRSTERLGWDRWSEEMVGLIASSPR